MAAAAAASWRPRCCEELLAGQPRTAAFAQLLVGTETGDDAAVWQIDDETCVIATTDFFMPMVDDPRDFGRIAATNALSDVYAMGGRPIMALAVLGMPIDKLPPATIRAILEGGAEICAEAGIPVAGGHSIDAPEPIYGLAVDRALPAGGGAPQRRRPAGRRADPDQGDRRRDLFGRDQEGRRCRRPAMPSSSPRRPSSTGSARACGGMRASMPSPTSPASASSATRSRWRGARGDGASSRTGRCRFLAQAEALARRGPRHRRLGAELGELWRTASRCRRTCRTGGAQVLTDPQTSGGLLIACDAGAGGGIAAQHTRSRLSPGAA